MQGGLRTVRELLTLATDYFQKKGITSSRLDAELLLAHVLKIDRVKLYCSLEQPVDGNETSEYRELVRRRKAFEPIAYITGQKEFYGLKFAVSPDVLIPRPDTETLIEAVRDLVSDTKALRICDVGTGSGAIAVTLASLFPKCDVTATDLSKEAIELATKNAETHCVKDRIHFIQCDLISESSGRFDLIVSNPPYIPDKDREDLQPEIRLFEPEGALFGGEDGLDVIRRLISTSVDLLVTGGSLLVEIDGRQSKKVANLIRNAGVFDTIGTLNDLTGKERVVLAQGFQGVADG